MPSDVIYFDWNSTAPPAESVLEAMAAAARSLWGNPSSTHGSGRLARAALESARERVAQLLEVHPRDVVFTGSATEANNLALRGASALITSRIEHPSVVRVAEALQARGRHVHWLAVPSDGRIRVEAVEQALDGLGEHGAGATITLMAANHETGVLQPVDEVATLAKARGARLHVDAVQLLGKGQLALQGADSIAIASHKIRGPKGIAALAFRGPPPQPVLLGGAQERGLRPGTLDAAAAVGFEAALRRLPDAAQRVAQLAAWRDRLEAELAPFAQVNGGEVPRLAHVSNLSFRGWPGAELVAALDLQGVRVSSGSACSAGTEQPSAVIEAMLGADRARSAVRFSMGEATTEVEVERVIAVCRGLLGAADSR